MSAAKLVHHQVGGVACDRSPVGKLVTEHRDPNDQKWDQQKPYPGDTLTLELFLICETEVRESSFGEKGLDGK
ncbi:MAG TPA: hypothetical protein DEF45_19690 [Rhodopirellula sp.]|nr:hypothetical protein [Rhodopirellula sp.]